MKNSSWIKYGGIAAVVLVALYIFTFFSDDTRSFMRVDTSIAIEQLNEQNVEEAQIDDREQQLRLTLREPITVEEQEGVEEIIAKYPARTSPEIFDSVRNSGAENYQTNVTQDSIFMSMFSFLLPMLILFAVLFWFISRMQSGAGGMFGIGGSKAKELTKDMPTNTFEDVAGADEAVDELQEIKDFLVRVRPCSLARWLAKLAFLSTPSLVRTSLKCSSAWAHPAYVTCSSRLKKIVRALSSSMRSMQLVASVVRAPAADMMSVSRPSTSYWWRWTVLATVKASFLSLLPTGQIFWTPRYCARDVLTARFLSPLLTWL